MWQKDEEYKKNTYWKMSNISVTRVPEREETQHKIEERQKIIN